MVIVFLGGWIAYLFMREFSNSRRKGWLLSSRVLSSSKENLLREKNVVSLVIV